MIVYDIGMRIRFRGVTRRQGLLFEGKRRWAEWSPFLDYFGEELKPWLRAAQEAADHEYPKPVRNRVGVNAIIPAIPAPAARRRAAASGCRTVKVKIAEPGEDFAQDQARVEAVRDGLGPKGRIRVDCNGAWDVDQAVTRLRVLSRYDIEYAEQPVATTEELAELRRRLLRSGVPVPIAADESIRRSDDPQKVIRLAAADVAVLKVQPLGGVRACLEWAQKLAIPVVVSSALETSLGIAAGLALAAALPELPYDCGLNTVNLLESDVVKDSLLPVDGFLEVRDPQPEPDLIQIADPDTTAFWLNRLNHTKGLQ